MTHTIGRGIALAAFLIFIGSIPALAIPVAAPFGSDTFPRAIHFTGVAKPNSSSNGAIQNLLRGQGTGVDSGIIMRPVGDGSYACTAAVYAGASYTYYFSFRNREFEADTTASWLTTRPNGERDQDVNRARTITIPTTATSGYYIYNAYGSQTVLGSQGADSSVLTTLNPYLATIGGTGDSAGVTRLATESGDTKFANMQGSAPYNVAVVQTGDSSFLLSWAFSVGGSEAFVPSVQGAARFGKTSQMGSSPQYGFRIWRSDSPVGGIAGAVFIDRTAAITGGDTNWSDNNTDPWDGQSITDTSWPDTVTRALYLVTWHNAYGYTQTDTARQNFSGGYDTATRGTPIRVFFIVEHYDENVVFPNGENQGKVYLTPYIDGVRRPDLRMPATAIRAQRRNAV